MRYRYLSCNIPAAILLTIAACDQQADQSRSRSNDERSAPAESAPTQFSSDFENNPTDEDYRLLLDLAKKGEKTLPPAEVAAIKVQAFIDAYETAREHSQGSLFVARIKAQAAQAASTISHGIAASTRADKYLDKAYDTYDAAHNAPSKAQYSTQELIEILVIAGTAASTANDQQALRVIEGSLIHVYSAARDAGLPPRR